MPATTSQLRRPIVVDHTLDFGDGVTITFRFDRNRITDAWVREWMAIEEQQDTGAINLVLADLIQGWDVVNDDGTAYPPTAANIGELFTLADKGWIVRELMTASVPSRAEGKASSAPTSTEPSGYTAPPVQHQNGPEPSAPPEPLASPYPM